MYEDVLQALVTATTDLVAFRNRPQSRDKLKSMLLALVARGINLYLRQVEAREGKEIAEMTLHRLCYVASTAFAIEDLEGRWVSSKEETDKRDSKRAKKEQVIAIIYRCRPKFGSELTPRGQSSAHGSMQYPPHVKRGSDALDNPFIH